MKRLVLLYLALTLVFSLFACAKSDVPIDPAPVPSATDPTADPGSNGPSKPENPTTPSLTSPQIQSLRLRRNRITWIYKLPTS